MPQTIQCQVCGIVLNVPDQAIGKRLKCPKCGTKFSLSPSAEGSPASTFLLPSTRPPSSEEVSRRPASSAEALPVMHNGKRPPSSAEALPVYPKDRGVGGRADSSADAMPVASGDLRDRFAVPLQDDLPPASEARPKPGGTTKPVADVEALFKEDPKPSRRRNAAEARASARRCPTCGGVVPVGMSLCSKCGLDLESGMRVALDDTLDPTPVPSGPTMPLPIGIIGGVCFLGSVIFTIATLSLWAKGYEGYQYFVPLCAFAVFASVQFVRRKTAKLLLIALTFGVMIDFVALVAMPIVHANTDARPIQRTGEDFDPDQADVIIPSVAERIDTQKLSLGIGLILAYAGVSVYLLSPQARRYFR